MAFYPRNKGILFVLSLFAYLIIPAPADAQVRLFSIGSGDLSGGYFATARAICNTFNYSDDTPRRCSPEPTVGSIYNLTMMRSGELDFALVQSDWQRAAYEGTGPFAKNGPMIDLRGVISLYPEAITILAAPGSGITISADLAGKVVDIGSPSSGRNATVRVMLKQLGLDESFFGDIREFESSHAIAELCAGRIDAAIFVVGHPNDIVAKTLEQCSATIAAFIGPNVDRIAAESRDYQKVRIDQNLYGIEGEGVETLAVVATLVTRASIESDLVADLVTAIQDDLDNLTSSVPLLRHLDSNITAPIGMSAPLHPGAVQALKTSKQE
jgi:uncharacterized protein